MRKRKTEEFYFFKTKEKVVDPWQYLRLKGKRILSEGAQLKLEWIIFYHTIGKKNASSTATHFGISRKTFHKWFNRFDESCLGQLEEVSRSPQNKRTWMVTALEEVQIKRLRMKNLELGKKKLQILYSQEFGSRISTWKIERVIRKYSLYPEMQGPKRLSARKKKLRKKRLRIHTLTKELQEHKAYGLLWHIDAIVIWWYGHRRIIFTALDDATKIAYARIYPSNTSSYAEDFLKRLRYVSDDHVSMIHTDNGSEFAGAFEKACTRLRIQQIYSRPHTPKDNPSLEKFNHTIQREWLDQSVGGLDTIPEANKDLTTWLVKYNSYRPHQSLDYKTPFQYASDNFLPLLPKWTAASKT